MIPPKGGCYNLLWAAAGDKEAIINGELVGGSVSGFGEDESLAELEDEELPEFGEESLPEFEEESLSELEEESLPELDDESLPELDDVPLPEDDDDSLPELDDDPSPDEEEESLPELDDEPLPELADELLAALDEDPPPEDDDEAPPELDDALPELADELDAALDEPSKFPNADPYDLSSNAEQSGNNCANPTTTPGPTAPKNSSPVLTGCASVWSQYPASVHWSLIFTTTLVPTESPLEGYQSLWGVMCQHWPQPLPTPETILAAPQSTVSSPRLSQPA
ncbi:hypothetical protein HO133_004731 [Letharia lupina]|uniref:Uncharacterized protein n=1 Tax=Letharia lupina TaxID=560253 RepID=A0A8H6FKU9_9LECA|nr:uncharacterized protein HO133_004731 [Letharia lupina]KAF6230389.1 hypothetical protein HO133_004731 [Letharia lupina]